MRELTQKIVKGILYRLQRKTRSRYPGVPWFQQKILKHQGSKNEKQIKINGHTIYYKKPYEVLYTYQVLFKEELYRFQTGNKAPVILDCGANIGLSILYFKKLFPAAVVHAYEADAGNFALLEKNVKSNQLADVHLHFGAVWTQNGSVSFLAEGSEASHVVEGNNQGNAVPAFNFAEVLQQHQTIDFLKIDIEGAEWKVLMACGKELKKAANIFIEYHGNVDETQKLADLINLVADLGYKVYVNHATDNLKHPFFNRSSGLPYDIQLHLFCYRDFPVSGN